MMSDVMEIKAKADRLVELTSQQSVIKAEIDEIKAWFEKLATDDLRDTRKRPLTIGAATIPRLWSETARL